LAPKEGRVGGNASRDATMAANALWQPAMMQQ
jgi:hypothetical protein